VISEVTLAKFTKFSKFSFLYYTYCTAVSACVLFQFPAVTCPVTLEKRYHGILSAKLVNFMEVCVCVCVCVIAFIDVLLS